MTSPSVNIRRLDNQVGVQTDLSGDYFAVVGYSLGGSLALNTPATVARRSDLSSLAGSGPLVEAAALLIDLTGKPVVICRTDKTTDGAIGTVTQTGTGLMVATATAGAHPIDDFEALVTFTKGGTVGVTGIEYTVSLDGGRNTSAVQALGTATTLVFQGSVGVSFDLTSATVVAGDTISSRTTAPLWNDSQLAAALVGLKTTAQPWRGCLIVGNVVNSGDVGTIDTAAAAMEALGKERYFVFGFRTPNAAESDSTYQAAYGTAFDSVVSNFCIPSGGAVEILSPVSQNRYMRPVSWAIAYRLAMVRPGVDVAAIELGPLPASFNIFDERGNPKHHDERYQPGLDAKRCSTLKTWEGRPGVYINNANVMSALGSDLKYAQHLRCIGIACEVTRKKLEEYSSADLLVNATTGHILEQEAVDIKIGVEAALRIALVDTGDVSGVSFEPRRDDNILATFTLNGDARIIPKAYPKTINANVGFYNPAAKLVAVAT